MSHYDELYPGRFLKGTCLDKPITIRILSLGGEKLAGDDGEKAKGILRYRTAGPDGKPIEGEIVWCKTNSALAAAIFGTPIICGRKKPRSSISASVPFCIARILSFFVKPPSIIRM